MSIQELAADFVALCKTGAFDEAAEKHWSDDVISLEPTPDGPHAVCEGRAAVLAKHAWWDEQAEMHSFSVDGPFIHGDQFTVIFQMDCTMQPYGRADVKETGLYTVKDGKIVEERFFCAPMPGM